MLAIALMLGSLAPACNFDSTGQGTAYGSASSDEGPQITTGDEGSGVGTKDGTGVVTGGGSTGGTQTTPGDTTMAPEDTGTTAQTGPCEPQPWFPDTDDDGFGDPEGEVLECDPPPGYVGQAGDCNDREDTINPDADETCNGQDDDCDGIEDEGSTLNPECNGCVFVQAVDGSRWFAVCGGTGTRDEAQASCIGTFGPDAELARIDDAADQATLLGLIGGTDHWLSLNDLTQEGLWRWHDDSVAYTDGASVGFDGWRSDQPIFGNGERCGELDPGGWADAGCTQPQPRICEHPL